MYGFLSRRVRRAPLVLGFLLAVPAVLSAAGFLPPPGLLDFAVYATGTACDAIKISGNGYVDSFDSSKGAYNQTKQQSKGIVGVSGNINLSGSATVYGPVFAVNTGIGSCQQGVPGITLSGKAQATGGYFQLPVAVLFQPVPVLPPGTSGAMRLASNSTLAPGIYGDVTVSGGKTLTLTPGNYTLNSLTLTGNSVLTLNPAGPVLLTIVGNNVQRPIDFSGGGIDNPSGIPLNLQVIYGGTFPIALSGGSASYAVLYAPNADVSIGGGSDWYGAMAVRTLDDSGGVAIHYDRSLAVPPTITSTVSPAPNLAGWNHSNVTVTFTCADPILGITSCTPPVSVATEGANQVVTGTAVNRAGFSSSISAHLNIDKTPPTVSAVVSPPPNAAGWNNTSVAVFFTCTDALSGLSICPAPVTVAANAANQVIAGTASDKAGNIATASVTINLDQTPPTITAAITPPPNAAGWNNANVVVKFLCADSLSGIASCQGPASVTAEGAGQVITGTASDVAGNVASASATVNLDKTPPSVTIISPVGGTTLFDPLVDVTGKVTDVLSGVASVACNGAPGFLTGSTFGCNVNLGPGANSIMAQVTDIAGNVGSTTVGISEVPLPIVSIASPQNLSYVNTTPVTVNGTVNDPTAKLSINGIPVAQSSGSFSASVPLSEGSNTLTIVAQNSVGNIGTGSIIVTLDTTPPHVTIDSPVNNFVTSAASISVSGVVNDIVLGTVNEQQATVTVNGIAAQVSNRSFLASNVPLAVGTNTMQVVGRDRAGNSATANVQVQRISLTQPSIKVVSGDGQSGAINTPLPVPLIAMITDGSGNPVPGKPIVFMVVQNNGVLSAGGAGSASVTVKADSTGRASVQFTLGSRAGAGNNRVEAMALGFAGTAAFIASGVPANATQLNVDSGSQQVGAVGSALTFPFVAVVTDNGHNRVANVPVTFSIKQGGGNLGGSSFITTNTDSDGRALATLTLGATPGQSNNVVEANFPGNLGLPAAFVASALTTGDPGVTGISGVVLANNNLPIPGVTIRLFQPYQGNNSNQPVPAGTPVQTNAQGQFLIKPAPVGFFKLMADGTTAQSASYPTLEYDIITVAGQNNTVGMPIYLPALDTVNKLCVNGTTGGTLKLPNSPGFSLTVAPGAATFPGGAKTGCISVTPVNGDKVPMTPGFGQQPRFIVTIQPVGTTFNPPAAITLPNVDGLKPRQITEMYSYDHDLSAFVAIGTATVSADGSEIVSDPGVGVLKAGWHCGGDSNPTGSAGTCTFCQDCQGSQCVDIPPTINPTQTISVNFDKAYDSVKGLLQTFFGPNAPNFSVQVTGAWGSVTRCCAAKQILELKDDTAKLAGTAGVKTGDIPIPGFAVQFPLGIQLGLFGNAAIGVSASYSQENNLCTDINVVTVTGSISISGGIKAALTLPDKVASAQASGTWGVSGSLVGTPDYSTNTEDIKLIGQQNGIIVSGTIQLLDGTIEISRQVTLYPPGALPVSDFIVPFVI